MEKIKSLLKNRSAMFCAVFFLLFFVCIFIDLIYAIRSDGASFYYSLFYAETESTNRDFFMDFFNSIRDAGDLDVYDKGVIYPPLANLLFFFFSKFISKSLTDSDFDMRYSLQMNQRAVILYLLFALICVIGFSLIVKYYMKKSRSAAVAEVFSFMFIFFYPFYYCVERGNILLLAMILSAFFVFFHNSQSKTVRELSYIVLALAAGLKIYPAFFGLILLVEKRYKAALKTVLYGILCFFVPFLAYDFGNGLFQLIENVLAFSQTNKASFTFGSTSIMNLAYYLGDRYIPLGRIAFVVLELLAVFCAFLAPQKWQKYLALTYMIINIQSVSSTYAAVFLLIPFYVFMSGKTKKQPADWIYLILFCLLLIPLPCLYYYNATYAVQFYEMLNLPYSSAVNKLVAWPATQLMFFLVVVESFANLIHAKKKGIKLSSFFYKKPVKRSAAKKPDAAVVGKA